MKLSNYAALKEDIMLNHFPRVALHCTLTLSLLAVLQIPLIGQALGAEKPTPPKIAPSAAQPVATKTNVTTKSPAVSQEALEIQRYGKVKITVLDVPWPPADCKRTTWRAQIFNGNPDTVYQLQLEGWQFNGNQQRWDGAGYSEVFLIEGNQTKVLEGYWNPGPYATKYKMVLHPKGKNLNKYEERVQELVIPASANLEILPPEFNGDNWKVTLKNNGATSECAISVQTYMVKKSSGARVGTGGLAVKVPSNGVGSAQNNITQTNWRTNFDEFLVDVRRAPTWSPVPGPGWTTIKSQSFTLPGHQN
jgi:hypothetical protein